MLLTTALGRLPVWRLPGAGPQARILHQVQGAELELGVPGKGCPHVPKDG